MTYNPNEFLRVKHLNEFARQLYLKLDGKPDPTQNAREVTNVGYNYLLGGSSTTKWFSDFSADNLAVSLATSIVPKESSKACYQISIVTPYDGVAPIVSNIQFTGNDTVGFKIANYGGELAPAYEQNRWRFTLLAGGAPSAGVLTFSVEFPRSNQFDSWKRDFTFTITEDD